MPVWPAVDVFDEECADRAAVGCERFVGEL